MSKDNKNQPTQGKELSEWQKRNQEYLRKKAEEDAKLAGQEAKTGQKSEDGAKPSLTSSQELSEWQKQHQEYLRKKAEREGKETEKEVEEEEKAETNSEEDAEQDLSSDPDEEVAKSEGETSTEADSENSDQAIEEENETDEVKEEKGDKKAKGNPKSPKPSIPAIHIWRAVSILIPSFLVFLFSIYLLTPYATLKNIEVTGNVQTSVEQIKELSEIQDSDYTISLFLNKDKHAEKIKSNYWIESANIHYQFPINFTIQVKEYGIVAYYVSGEDHYPILSSGTVETSPVSLVSLPETYMSVLFNDEQQVKTLIEQLAEVSPDIKNLIQKIEMAPSKVTSDLLKITMIDGDEILVPLSELGKKLPYYSKLKPQLTVPSGIDMEVGIYSYSLADMAVEEARLKAIEEAKKRQEEEKKKQEETSTTIEKQE